MTVVPLADDSPIDPDDELLVAYLDGELDAASRQDLEQRLLDSESLRRRLKYLQASWEWLEELPDPTTSEKSVETTLEFVVSDLASEPPPTRAWSLRYRWPLGIAALSILTAVTAASAVAWQRRAEFHRELTDLATAENLQAYLHGSNFELMRQLASHPGWSRTIATAQQFGELPSNAGLRIVRLPISERADAIPEMSVDDRTRLAYRWDQFAGLDENVQQQLRHTAQSVAQQPDAERLLETMRIYAMWRESLPADLRDQIERGSADERAAAIDQAVTRTQQALTRRSGTLLDDETIERIYFALRKILQQRIATLSLERREERQEWINRLREHRSEEDVEWMSLGFMLEPPNDPRGRQREDRSGSELRRPLSHEEIDMIEVILPKHAVDDLENLSGGDPLFEAATLAAWAEEAVRRKSPFQRGGPRSLLERYQRLDPGSRERLDLLPADQLLDRLTPEERRSIFSAFGPPSSRNEPSP